MDIPKDIRWQRVQQRNAEQGETFVMEVPREMFDFMQKLWIAPDDEKMAMYDGQAISN
ncbi:MAG: hypothetical protein ACU0CA_15430 [Paracoccaceae bacterium]